jgi:hypothetical protein
MIMRVTVAEIRSAMERLLSHLEETGQGEFVIEEDFYWSIPANALYDNHDQPSALTVGQLADDWSRLKAIADGSEEPIGYALVWAASVLRIVGERTLG